MATQSPPVDSPPYIHADFDLIGVREVLPAPPLTFDVSLRPEACELNRSKERLPSITSFRALWLKRFESIMLHLAQFAQYQYAHPRQHSIKTNKAWVGHERRKMKSCSKKFLVSGFWFLVENQPLVSPFSLARVPEGA